MEENIINNYAKRALRTICIAYKEVQPGDGKDEPIMHRRSSP